MIKTFALPKLIYPLTVLNNPPEQIINKILVKTEIFKFIWESKPDKIRRSVIMQYYKNGGLRLINVDYFIEALKAGCVRRILDEQIKVYGKNFILKN